MCAKSKWIAALTRMSEATGTPNIYPSIDEARKLLGRLQGLQITGTKAERAVGEAEWARQVAEVEAKIKRLEDLISQHPDIDSDVKAAREAYMAERAAREALRLEREERFWSEMDW